jgi:cellulose synthase/poly-beta-1,6-N-acetylglucosamine synthase-like glycosyltransferase
LILIGKEVVLKKTNPLKTEKMYAIFILSIIYIAESNPLFYEFHRAFWGSLPFWGLSIGITINVMKLYPEIVFGETGSLLKHKRERLSSEKLIRELRVDQKRQSLLLCLVITAYREQPETVLNTIYNLIYEGHFLPSQIVYVSDGCNDPWDKLSDKERATKKKKWDLLSTKEREGEGLKWYNTADLLIERGILPLENVLRYPNGQKAGSQKKAVNNLHLTKVHSDVMYVGLVDADIKYAGGYLPIEELVDKKSLGAALNIIPILRPEYREKIGPTIVQQVQLTEYLESMILGKVFSSRTGSIGTISGAFGIFKINHLKKNMEKETGRFPGDDQQRTLLAILNGGKIIFLKNTVYTYCPHNFWELQMQRTQKWWPGLWDNFPKMVCVLFSRQKHISPRLRFDMFYEGMFVTDFLKLWGIMYILYSGFWIELSLLSIFYMAVQAITISKIKKEIDLYPKYWILPFMLIYRICNITWRVIGGLQLLDTLVFKTGIIVKPNTYFLKKNRSKKIS